MFSIITQVRLSSRLKKAISQTVKKCGGEVYNNESHFVRCAIIRLLREEGYTFEIRK